MRLRCPECEEEEQDGSVDLYYATGTNPLWAHVAQYDEALGYYLIGENERFDPRWELFCERIGHDTAIPRARYIVEGRTIRMDDDLRMEGIL